MNLLPLPTDNLYKFFALTGVALIGFCAFFMQGAIEDLRSKDETVTLMLDQAEIDADYWKTIGQRNNQIIDRAVGEKKPDPENKVIVPITPEELEKRVFAEFEASKNLKQKVSEIKRRNDQLKRLVNDINFYKWVTGILVGIGVNLSIFGFVKWWKIQRLQDRLLEAEAAKV